MDILKKIFLLILILITFNIFAEINLFSPGKLSKHHQELEGAANCTKCHSQRGKAVINKNSCLSCHVEIKKRLNNNKKVRGVVNDVKLLPRSLWKGHRTFGVFIKGENSLKYCVLEPCNLCGGGYGILYDNDNIVCCVHIFR